MEAEGTNKQEDVLNSNRAEQETESGGAQIEVKGDSKVGKAESMEKEAKVDNKPAEKSLETEELLASDTSDDNKKEANKDQSETEEKVAVGISGTEPKEEADHTGIPEVPQEGEGADATGENASISSKKVGTLYFCF